MARVEQGRDGDCRRGLDDRASCAPRRAAWRRASPRRRRWRCARRARRGSRRAAAPMVARSPSATVLRRRDRTRCGRRRASAARRRRRWARRPTPRRAAAAPRRAMAVPASSPPPPIGATSEVEVGHLLQQLARGRALAGDHPRVVVGMHHDGAGLGEHARAVVSSRACSVGAQATTVAPKSSTARRLLARRVLGITTQEGMPRWPRRAPAPRRGCRRSA